MFKRMEQRLGRIARRKTLALVLVGAAPLVIRALLLPWLPPPNPRVQDEFSHLLIADTFAHGRAVNPVHPMWVHFESMHILVRPVYASVFPVAPGLIMAAAQLLTGVPWLGVWLSVGLMCAALCWMLQGWVPPGWALLGGALAVARYGIFSYWMNSYFGGAVAAAGGALILGALPRLMRRRRWEYSACMALGLIVLANSRPYEGAILGLMVLGALGVWMWRAKPRALPIVWPLVLIGGAGAAAMGWYFAHFTGRPLVLPYAYYRSTETMAPHFIWQSPRPQPVYHHRVLRKFYTEWEMGCYLAARANRDPHSLAAKAMSYWRFFLGPVLTIPLLAIPRQWKRRGTRFLLLVAAVFCAALAVQVWNAPHYAAPAMGAVLLLVIAGLRQVRQAFGAYSVRLLFVACVLFPVPLPRPEIDDGSDRARIQKQLAATGERHVVFVRYRFNHDTGDEWVYNSADIDNSPVVWTREMDPTSNRELLDYFKGRRVWLVEPDEKPVPLSGFDPGNPPVPPFGFVKLGTAAITVLRSPLEIRRKVLDRTGPEAATGGFTCDQWNFYFTQVTGVATPDPGGGCFPPGRRGQIVSLDYWFDWLQRQQ